MFSFLNCCLSFFPDSLSIATSLLMTFFSDLSADIQKLNTLEVEGIRFRIALMSNAVNFLST